MVSIRPVVICAVCFYIILVLWGQENQSRRSGGNRAGSRSRSSRTFRSGRFRSRVARVRRMRVRRGSSRFTSHTWEAAARGGTIYGGHRYLQSSYYRTHPDRMPAICANQEAKTPNGRVYGLFICPRETEPANYTWCCGAPEREFCCPLDYYRGSASSRSRVSVPGDISEIIAAIVVSLLSLVAYRLR